MFEGAFQQFYLLQWKGNGPEAYYLTPFWLDAMILVGSAGKKDQNKGECPENTCRREFHTSGFVG